MNLQILLLLHRWTYGGAVYLDNIGANGLLTNCTFENSSANSGSLGNLGQTIYSKDSDEIYNSTFLIKSGESTNNMVYDVPMETLLAQLNKFVLKSFITTTDFSSKYGSNVTLTATVKNEAIQHLSEGSVTFYKNGTLIGTANVINGVASYNYTCDDSGIFELKAVYSGSNNYGPSTAIFTLTIQDAILETNISVNNISTSYNNTVTLTASITTKEKIVVNGGTITFYIEDTVIGTASVVNGVATCSYKCSQAGIISVRAVFSGSNHFNSSNNTFNLNVAKLDVTVVVNPINASYGKSFILSATVKNNNVNVDGGIVEFYVDDFKVGTATVSGGVATCSYTHYNVGTFNYRVDYKGFDYYNPSTASSTFHVDSLATNIVMNDIYTNYGANINLTATVKTRDNVIVDGGI